jgi:hypothetical protein
MTFDDSFLVFQNDIKYFVNLKFVVRVEGKKKSVLLADSTIEAMFKSNSRSKKRVTSVDEALKILRI